MMNKLKNIALVFILLCAFSFYGQETDQRFKIADSLLDAKEYEQALELSLKLEDAYPNNAQVFINLAYCYHDLSQNEQCLQVIEKATALSADEEQKHALYYLQADTYSKMQRYEEAKKYCAKYLKYYPEEAYGLNLKGWLLYREDKYDEALAEFGNAIGDADIDNEEKTYSLAMTGFCYLGKENLEKAKLYKDFAIISDWDNYDANFLSANILFYEKDFKSALKIYNTLSQKDTNDYSLMYQVADCYYYMKDYDKALSNYKASLAKSPASGDINNMVAWTLFLKQSYNEALPYANKAIELDKTDGNSYDTRGCIYYKTGNYPAAFADLNKSIKLDKTSTNSYYFRGLCFLKTGKNKEACDDFNKALADKEYKTPVGEIAVETLISTNCKQ